MKYLFFSTIFILIALSKPLPVTAGSTFSCADVTEIPQIECEALVAFYESTNGPGWLFDTNWLVTDTPSDWDGVYVTSGHVTALGLRGNNITGKLPPEIGNLTSLTWFLLEENAITGSIPPEIGNLVNLEYLEIGWNNFSGNLPPEIGNLVNLAVLNLISNDLNGSLPSELGNLASLTFLDMSFNDLTGSIPPDLGKLTALSFMNLASNQFTGSLPPELGDLSSLNALFLFNNPGLSGRLPFHLTNLSLGTFWYEETGLCDPPDPIFQAWLYSISSWIGNWLHCDSAALCADITEVSQADCKGLVELYYSTNGRDWSDCTNWFVTNTPGDWFGVTASSGNVLELNLPVNNLSGILPSDLGNMSSLVTLDLSENFLHGTIPVEMGNLSNLSEVNLSGNDLSGSSPIELGNLISLLDMNLSDNLLIGSVPAELGNLSNLQILNLSKNRLSGSLPAALSNLSSLKYLILESNKLGGSIPPELGNLASILQINLRGNSLGGNIPVELASLNFLERLDLSKNQLTGSIPAELGTMASLGYLDLSVNRLSGNIPDQFGMSLFMWFLDLSHNQIGGVIPSQVGDMAALKVLHLEDNLLEGDVPPVLINLGDLLDPGQYDGEDGLDLDYNYLRIPTGYPIPGDPFHEFLHQKDPDWHLFQAFEQVIGADGGQLTSLDGRTDIIIPESALITDTKFTFIPHPGPLQSFDMLKPAHNSFELIAEDMAGNPVTIFNQPLGVTLSYSDAEIFGIPEGSLGLFYWDIGTRSWIDAITSCPGGTYTRNLNDNTLALLLCHLTEFGLFGEPLYNFMPMVWR